MPWRGHKWSPMIWTHYRKDGEIKTVYDLELKVKVPTGMTESDLARPVIEIRNFDRKIPSRFSLKGFPKICRRLPHSDVGNMKAICSTFCGMHKG